MVKRCEESLSWEEVKLVELKYAVEFSMEQIEEVVPVLLIRLKRIDSKVSVALEAEKWTKLDSRMLTVGMLFDSDLIVMFVFEKIELLLIPE